MKHDMVMPKMGESITEGTIIKWLKQIGDAVEKDEIILEISTDKVDSEIPTPVSGKIIEFLANENDTVEVGKVIARIEIEGDQETTQTERPAAPDTETVKETAPVAESAPVKESIQTESPSEPKLAVPDKDSVSKSSKFFCPVLTPSQ